MKVGFTGTRKGMSEAQFNQLRVVLRRWLQFAHDAAGGTSLPEFHHGESPNGASADLDARDEAVCYGFKQIPHPPKDDTPAAMLARNRDIATIYDILIAAPETDKEVLRSGTWATVRYARACHKPIIHLSRGEV